MILESERLLLKSHTKDNYDKIFNWMNDSELLFFDDDEPEPLIKKTKEEIDKTMERLTKSTPEAKRGIIHFAIHKKINNELIGYCMIAFIDDYHKKCNIGLTIENKNEWGKGFGKETVISLIDYIFKDLNMNRIQAEVYSHNQRSINLFESIGFIKEGIIRESVLKNGKYEDEYIYGLLRKDKSSIIK